MKIRTLGASAAVMALATVGVAGVAGAVTPSGQAASHPRAAAAVARIEAVANAGALPSSFNCATAATKQARISTAVSKINARISTAQTREATASANGNTARATAIGARISKAQTFVTDLGTVSSLITAKCG